MSKLVDKSRLFMAAFGFVLAVVYGTAASRLPIPAFSDPVGPRMFPYILAAGLCIASVALLIEYAALKRRDGNRRSIAAGEEDGVSGVALAALGMLTVYYMVFDYLGFLIASILFLLAFLTYSNRSQWKVNLIVALLFPAAAYLLLDTLFGARLPEGILDFG
ncbi:MULTISPECIES: tripartite tricarboxylate transporter TctB family protein [unclassified Sinorhizobium]|uniref:tripartite tricarboxylate transporter TctB family protein n=1 Tax=unclassified Sinorhizobium TaxID=2613772 RepID=UPI0035260A54